MAKSSLFDSRIKKYAFCDADQIYKNFGTTPAGLNDDQVDEMREKHGKNSFTKHNNNNFPHMLQRAFINPFNVVLFILGVITLFTDIFLEANFPKNSSTAIIIFTMILISGIIRLIQEIRAKNAADKLSQLSHDSIMVRRDGDVVEIYAEELVVGDTVLISAGDRVPADIRLTKTSDLFISQGAITGESAIVEKDASTLKQGDSSKLQQLDNLAFMATTVIGGKGEGVVLAVGRDTLYGSYAKPSFENKNLFQKGANSISWVVLRFMAVLLPIMFVLLGITNGNWLESFAFSLSVAVGLMPEMLPMVITACLAKGSLTMGRKRTIIKDINAMQGFGSIDVLCMDKTGTLTNENMVLEYYTDILGNESSEVLDLAYINSYCHSGVRNPIDNSILACKTMPGHEAHYTDLITHYTEIDEIPFDYTRKMASTLVRKEDGNHLLIMKGDIDRVSEHCKFVGYNGDVTPMEGDVLENIYSVVGDMLEGGMKVIAVAQKDLGAQSEITPADESDMVLVGYIAFFDAPKASTKDSVLAMKKLNVAPKILTGDQPEVAKSVCRRVGIDAEQTLTGEQLDEMTDSELEHAVEEVNVFAELTPGQKLRIVSAISANGHTVGFIGDGINDIPALNEANVGISVDTAVDAAKDAADVILLQKDLNVLEEGIMEGRKIFTNMLKYIKITASSNFGNILAIFIAAIFLPFLPMTSVQILLLNLVYDIICIFIPWDNVDDDQVNIPQVWPRKTFSKFMGYFGPLCLIFDMIAFAFFYYILCPAMCGGQVFSSITDVAMQAQYTSIFQTAWFLESVWTEVLVLLLLRTGKTPFIRSRASAPFMGATVGGVAVVTAVVMLGGAAIFGLVQLPIWFLAFLVAEAILYALLATPVKRLYLRKYKEMI